MQVHSHMNISVGSVISEDNVDLSAFNITLSASKRSKTVSGAKDVTKNSSNAALV